MIVHMYICLVMHGAWGVQVMMFCRTCVDARKHMR